MTDERKALIELLERRLADQREHGGDLMHYGGHDPLDEALLAFLKGVRP